MDRFDLEQQIMELWGTDKEIELIYEHVMDVEVLDRDTIANALLGLSTMHHLKGEKLFKTFETLIERGVIGND